MDDGFRPLDHPLAFAAPERLTGVDPAHAHIPFAMALVSALRPRMLVEVGTYGGDAYSAMCQAVDALGLPARCFAIGDWAGDGRDGGRGDDVFLDLRAHHARRFGSFSVLLRASSEDARAQLADGTVDLLHLDGLTALEDARRAFAAWRPKLSPRAVVLVHHTNARAERYGLWRFWEEVRAVHPSFEFAHGEGLGVLAVGTEAPAEILALCATADDARVPVARLYQALGERVAYLPRPGALAPRDERLRELEAEAAHLHELLAAEIRRGGGPRLGELWRRLVAAVRRKAARGALGRKLARRRRRRELRLLRRSGLFDRAWYAATNPEVVAAGMDPLAHFYDCGASEGRDPNPWFDTSWYVTRIGRAAAGVNPLVHYLKVGARELRDPHPRFRAARYLAEHSEVEREGLNPLAHFLGTAGRDASPAGKGPAGLLAADAFSRERAALATGVGNAAWHGGEAVEPAASAEFAREAGLDEATVAEIEALDTRAVLRYAGLEHGASSGGAPSALARELAPRAEIERHLAAIRGAGVPARADAAPSFTVVTPFYRHRRHFDSCAASMDRLVARSGGHDVEWIVVNDDPGFSAHDLASALTDRLRAVTRVLSDGRNLGIVRRLNEAIVAARNEWILFLDCDDLLVAEAVEVLARYVRRFPRCRYVSSAMVDIGERGEILRYRRRLGGPARLLTEGMTAGHLKAVRRDAFDAHGLLDPAFDGCQDYEFALRLAFEEPLLYVPEYLYHYRWHRASQSVAQGARQTATADAVVRKYARRFLASVTGDRAEGGSQARDLPRRGVAIVRTQGGREELLAEALQSLAVQDPPVTAVVVVHGDRAAVEAVERLVRELGRATVLHAPDTRRLRGYPLNVALRHLLAPERCAEEPGFLFFLDDDDVVYPSFSRKMHEALSATGADLVHAASNRRVPWQPAEPAYAPLPAPCLLVRNFIPINAYAVRFSALRESGLEFSEELSVVEDWDFLVSALAAGLRFFPLADALSEFRVIGDGNRATKRDPELWAACEAAVRARALAAIAAVGGARLVDSLVAFPPELLQAASPADRELVLAARALLDDACARDAARARGAPPPPSALRRAAE